jgi:hypothetical protein
MAHREEMKMTSSKFLSVKTFIVPFAAAAGLMLVASADSSLAGGQRTCNAACQSKVQNQILGKALQMNTQPSADSQILNSAPINNG